MGRLVGFLPNMVMCIKHWMYGNAEKYVISSCDLTSCKYLSTVIQVYLFTLLQQGGTTYLKITFLVLVVLEKVNATSGFSQSRLVANPPPRVRGFSNHG